MYLGLDLGTTNVKAVALDGDGRIAAEASAQVQRFSTPDGGIEHDLEQIWSATRDVLGRVTAEIAPQSVLALGVSSQGGALQMLDADDRPAGRVISWLDPRGKPYDRRLMDEVGETYLVEHLGCNLSSMTLGQLLRLAEQAPERFAAPGLGFVGDTIVGRLCGRRAHDATSLSIGMLYNPTLGTADPEMLARLKIDGKRLPELLPVTSPAGGLLDSVARATGLPAGIPVSPAVHDQYAAAIGAGATREGDVCLGTGTAWVLLANAVGAPRPVTPGTFTCPHPIAPLTGHLLSMVNGGSTLDWAVRLTDGGNLSPDQLDRRLESIAPGADGLRVWPLLAASAAASGRLGRGGRIDGLTLAHTADHLLRAIVEGLACELARHVERLASAGFSLRRLVLSGPAATSRVTPRIVADVTARPAVCVGHVAMSARGAAVIARAMVERDCPLGELAERCSPERRLVQPGPGTALYARLLEAYLEPFHSAEAP